MRLAPFLLPFVALLVACEDTSRSRRHGPVTQIVYAVDLGAVDAPERQGALDQTVARLRQRLDAKGIRDATVVAKGDAVVVELSGADADAIAQIRDLLTRTANLEFKIVAEDSELMQALYRRVQNDPEAIRLDLESEIDSWRHDESGRTFNDYYLRAADRAVLELYFAKLPVSDPVDRVPDDRELGYEHVTSWDPNVPPYWRSYLLERPVRLDGSAVARASVMWDPQTNRPEVMVELDDDGARRFSDLTAEATGRKMAILLDGRITSAPVIQTRISGGRVTITMGGNDVDDQEREAQNLVEVLTTGALPVPIREESVTTIGR